MGEGREKKKRRGRGRKGERRGPPQTPARLASRRLRHAWPYTRHLCCMHPWAAT